MPADPMTPLAEAATACFAMFRAFLDAGFTEAQALHLVGISMTHEPTIEEPSDD